jgi:hypothetical protein
MAQTIFDLVCESCGKAFQRPAAEHNRNCRKGRKVYCSRSCAGNGNRSNIPKERDGYLLGLLNRGLPLDKYSPFRNIYRVARVRSEKVGREFTISLEDVYAAWERQQGKCPYSGWPLRLPEKAQSQGNIDHLPDVASIDRIDSSKGYTPDNIQIVCRMANYAKADWSHEQMVEFCRAVCDNWIGR